MWNHKHGIEQADVIVCRHTLEHIPAVQSFLKDIRLAIGSGTNTLLFFEVPDSVRVLEEGAFWDVYYEHCSYFSSDSLCALFNNCGFEVLECWLDYDEQYIMLTAKPSTPVPGSGEARCDVSMEQHVDRFKAQHATVHSKWTSLLQDHAQRGESIVLWGGGSKAAAFLNQLGHRNTVRNVIDINPNKHHCFIPGTGQEVVGPEFLHENAVRAILLMNPVYREEVQHYLDRNRLKVELLTL